MGGNGTWFLGYSHPEKFAAMVSICGFPGYPSFYPESTLDPFAHVAERISEIPIWIFHGDSDQVVSVEESQKMDNALRVTGADIHYTELPGVGHKAWDQAYTSELMINWLFKQRKQ